MKRALNLILIKEVEQEAKILIKEVEKEAKLC